jgi:hypothetical protein
MPYIRKEEREDLAHVVEHLRQIAETVTVGQLNYLITCLIDAYWSGAKRYYNIAMITGVLENVKQEFYRRVAAEYEDARRRETGDVYGQLLAQEEEEEGGDEAPGG